MAWINVHEDVVGPKLRDLAKRSGLSLNESLGTLIRIWLWGIKNADQSGLIKIADKVDVANVISSGISKGFDPIEVVGCMVNTGWIDEQGSELYLHDWDEWQEMWYKYLSKKEKDTARKRKTRENDKGAAAPPPEIPPPPSPPPTEPKTTKPEKKKCAEFVHMQESEYQKLIAQFGQKAVDKMIEVLDNYKGAKGKTYNNDYRAILNWVVKRVSEDFPGLIKPQEAPSTSGSENPFEEWSDEK